MQGGINLSQQILKKGRKKCFLLFEWLLSLFSYTLVFLVVSHLFKSFYIDLTHPYIYGVLAVFIIVILNQTFKPLLVTLTIPITGLTLGLFYPCINLFILKITDWILGEHFNLKNIWVSFMIAILISVMNHLMDWFFLRPIMRKVHAYE